MAEVLSSFTTGFFRTRLWTRSQRGDGSRNLSTALWRRWGGMGSTRKKNLHNGGALAAGADCWGEAALQKGELGSIYGGVCHWGRRRSARSITGRTYVKCNQEGHMSRDCPTAASGGRRGCLRCGEEGHMSRS
nr:DNA-binding protein HEXBP-like [Dermacentor andersoni]